MKIWKILKYAFIAILILPILIFSVYFALAMIILFAIFYFIFWINSKWMSYCDRKAGGGR